MNFKYDKFKLYVNDLAKNLSQSNYYVRFETKYKECDKCLINETFKKLYKSIPLQEVTIKETSNKLLYMESPYNMSCNDINHFKSKEAVQKAFKKLQYIFEPNMKIHQIIATEEYHPTPGIFWDFWYIPNPDIENTMLAQVLDAPRKPRKSFITNEVTLVFLDFLCTSVTCTIKRISISGFGYIINDAEKSIGFSGSAID